MNAADAKPSRPHPRVRTPTVLQMEGVECGAAALCIILSYYGREVPLETMRAACGVSRDGSKASKIVQAARTYGLEAKGVRIEEVEDLKGEQMPCILFWNFNHFLVLEGFGKKKVFLNDPNSGPCEVSYEEFEAKFTGVLLRFSPGPNFVSKKEESFNVYRCLRERLRGAAGPLSLAVVVSLFLVVPGLVVPAFSRIFVDQYLVGQSSDWIKPLLLAMAATAALRAALTWLQQTYLTRIEMKLALVASTRFFWHVLRLPVVFFTQRYAGEITGRLALNDQVAQLLSGQLATNILGVLTMGFFFIVMLQYSVSLGVVTLAIAALNFAVLGWISRARIDANQRLLNEQGKLLGTTMAGLQMMETLKASGAENDFYTRWAGYHAKALNTRQQLGRTSEWMNVTPVFLASINNSAILGFGGWLVMQGSMTLGMLVAFQSLMSSFLEPVGRLVGLGGSLQSIHGGLRRLEDVLRYPVDAQTVEAAPAKAGGAIKLSGRIELRNVSFGYSRLDPPLIQDFSLTVRPGERVALVGPSGCGKSTISRLISGMYEPWSGEILLDGKPRLEIPRQTLSHSLALVDQEIFLFEGSVRENLTLWDPTAPHADIVEAAHDAEIHMDIVARQGAYDSLVEETGRNFSGGQRQRLEIARALVNRPSILVLDEATSALDPKTEKSIDENLRRRGCACVSIAHRLSSIRDCDEIIVLDKGRIVERGTHEQLLQKKGLYANLIKT